MKSQGSLDFSSPEYPCCVQRGNNREPIVFDDSDYQAYLIWLIETSERYQCDIHAYVLMANHVHILATLNERESISQLMQYVNRRDFQLSLVQLHL